MPLSRRLILQPVKNVQIEAERRQPSGPALPGGSRRSAIRQPNILNRLRYIPKLFMKRTHVFVGRWHNGCGGNVA